MAKTDLVFFFFLSRGGQTTPHGMVQPSQTGQGGGSATLFFF